MRCADTANESSEDINQAFNVYTRSKGSSAKDPTHQYPQLIPPQVIESAHAGDDVAMLGALALTRRDATKCLSAGTCADGR